MPSRGVRQIDDLLLRLRLHVVEPLDDDQRDDVVSIMPVMKLLRSLV